MNKKRVLYIYIYILSILTLVAFISCASPAGGGSEGSETGLAVRMPGRALTSYDKTTVSIFTVTIKSSSYKDTKSAGSGETITFSQIPVGTYEVDAIAKDASGTIIAKTKNPVTVIVEQDKVSETAVTLSLLEYAVVQFNLNGGTAADGSSNIPDQNVTKGEKASAPANPTKSGNVFGGWKILPAPGEPVSNSSIDLSTYTINDGVTFQAIWNPSHSVAFDWDDGDNTITTIEVLPGEYVLASDIPNPTISGEGWTFAGWKSAGTTVSTSTITSTAITSPMTYTAVWKFTVKYWSEGTLFTSTQETFGNGNNVTTPSTVPTSSTGNIFKGWSHTQNDTNPGTPAGGTTSATVSDLRDNDGILNLYAVWDNYQFTVFAYELDSELLAIDMGMSSQTDNAQRKTGTSILSVTLKARESNTYEMFNSSNTSLGTGSISLLGISGSIKNFSFSANGNHYQCSSDSNLNFLGNYQVSYASPTLDDLKTAFGTAP